jgi:hypothetical protein
MDPTAAGNMADLRDEFARRQAVYDGLVQHALETNDTSQLNKIAEAKKAMNDTLSNMLALSSKTGTAEEQEELIERIMKIQRDYNGILASTDKLETLRRIHQFEEVQKGTGTKIFGALFVVASLALLITLLRR